MNFIKMHGAGNDYIFVDCFKNVVEQPEKLAVEISDRHFGVGSDGLVLILPSDIASCKMRIFNADGSEAKMCGNAIRCVGKYFYENYPQHRWRGLAVRADNIQDTDYKSAPIKPASANTLTIETISGIKTLELFVENNLVNEVLVDMGKADFTAQNIPIICNSSTYINSPIKIDGREFLITAVSMGNPHAVVFCGNVDEIPLETLGTKFEHHEIFPERVNTEFVQIINKKTLKMRVWERGSGETMACGTGTCASVAAAVKNNLLDPETEICVKLKGGELFITCKNDYQIFMRGNAVEVFCGEYLF
ncbi:MAG: diaminopimelate epimerase [Prevotellaceae bacterium]|jgi:diaminopimelate epimerase|nr:diaminopimelate epimerase [Prevotellaceae bacterium]